ncbi:hypothetical protein PTTG_29262 [Puccinia triticina 1-1 BBBD Race 1]|uniref:DUF659 domain-containing protein n=1 Tax=Puccinia triticina (isolate 1-1 / race 1 (BBBD)) TaxID=630390 RepID=A0A180G5Z1_PUCT1|nr:hypothetical protein PTTG_29262 [Puccinia triticina 1-1 BBBD Race 1]
MKQTQKRPRPTLSTPSSSPPKSSDANSQSIPPNAADTDIVKLGNGIDAPPSKQSSAPWTSRDTTDEEELAQKIVANTVSAGYSSYEKLELSVQLDKKGRHMIAYPCKMCSMKIHRPTYNSSCSHLLKNAAACPKKQHKLTSQQNLASLGISGTGNIDPQEVQQLCAVWCAEAAQPFSALLDESHKDILHPTAVKHMPLAKVVSESIHMLYTAVQDNYQHILKNHVGAMYLGADAWQSPNGHNICGIVIHQLVQKNGAKFNLEAMPLKFVWLAKSHTGNYLAKTMRAVMEKFDIQNQICGIVTDNASNNLSIIATMKKYVPEISISSKQDPSKEDPAKSEDLDLSNQDETLERELSINDIQDLSDEDDKNDAYTSVSCKKSLQKFRDIARKLCKSPNLKAEFVELCVEKNCDKPQNIKRDVQTRWNSTFAQIEGIIRCKKAIMI